MHRTHISLFFLLSFMPFWSLAQTEAQATEDSWVFQDPASGKTVEVRSGQRVYLETSSASGTPSGRYKISRVVGDELWLRASKKRPDYHLKHQEIQEVQTMPSRPTRFGGIFMILIGVFFSFLSFLGILSLLSYGGSPFYVILGIVGLLAGGLTTWAGAKIFQKFAAKVALRFWKWTIRRRTIVKKTVPLPPR